MDGPTIYSYGRHFPIARFDGANVVLFTSRDCSVSTRRHKRYVEQAIPSRCTVFVVTDPMATTKEEHRRNFNAMKEESDFGYWPSLSEIEELPTYDSTDAAKEAGEENDFKVVSDHGNVEVYSFDGQSIIGIV